MRLGNTFLSIFYIASLRWGITQPERQAYFLRDATHLRMAASKAHKMLPLQRLPITSKKRKNNNRYIRGRFENTDV